MPGWAAVNKKGEPTRISQPASIPIHTDTLASAASSSKPSTSIAGPLTQHHSPPKTPRKPKKKKATDAAKPATPTQVIPSPATNSDGSFPSVGRVIHSKQVLKPNHKTQATSQIPTSTIPALAETDGNIQCQIPKYVLETPHQPSRYRSNTVVGENSRSVGQTTDHEDDHSSTRHIRIEPASQGKETRRREQPVREVKLMASVEQTPHRGKGSHNRFKLVDAQCAAGCSDGDPKATLLNHQPSSILVSALFWGVCVPTLRIITEV